MAVTRVKKSKEAETLGKARDGKCLICGKAQNSRRGLCVAHYYQFQRAKMALPKSKRIAFEEKQILEGRILAMNQIKEIRHPTVFVEKSAS
jgi:hypothetical protein